MRLLAAATAPTFAASALHSAWPTPERHPGLMLGA
eukprot:CAMPEP_0183454812 /NCGR_PEP_ID=MMETSP0370-20130417/124989_1 /TAXON_ID=268820 /ORGANISM="Peridinium aciculiferum, Strain PAER-2" /LENGTH=34 /DNA_ID= /DNA_START= /DNA_END= /DNA_ORIENTATION=